MVHPHCCGIRMKYSTFAEFILIRTFLVQLKVRNRVYSAIISYVVIISFFCNSGVCSGYNIIYNNQNMATVATVPQMRSNHYDGTALLDKFEKNWFNLPLNILKFISRFPGNLAFYFPEIEK